MAVRFYADYSFGGAAGSIIRSGWDTEYPLPGLPSEQVLIVSSQRTTSRPCVQTPPRATSFSAGRRPCQPTICRVFLDANALPSWKFRSLPAKGDYTPPTTALSSPSINCLYPLRLTRKRPMRRTACLLIFELVHTHVPLFMRPWVVQACHSTASCHLGTARTLRMRSTAALGHDEPLVEARGGVKRHERDDVFVRGNLVERRNQNNKGKQTPILLQGVEDLIHTGDRQLAEAVNLVQLVVVHGGLNASIALRADCQRARIWRVRALDQTCRKVLVQGGSLGSSTTA